VGERARESARGAHLDIALQREGRKHGGREREQRLRPPEPGHEAGTQVCEKAAVDDQSGADEGADHRVHERGGAPSEQAVAERGEVGLACLLHHEPDRPERVRREARREGAKEQRGHETSSFGRGHARREREEARAEDVLHQRDCGHQQAHLLRGAREPMPQHGGRELDRLRQSVVALIAPPALSGGERQPLL
jgi:hypothetical protein